MRRLSLLLATLALAACGGVQSEDAPGTAPAPADLAADAVAALGRTGSAHYALNVDVREAEGAGFQAGARVEGDFSPEAVTAAGSVTFPGGSVTGRALAGEDEVFLELMGQWYGARDLGLGEQRDEAPTPEEVRERFDDVLTGSVTAGPDAGGEPTWRFEGRLDPDGLAGLDETLTERQREALTAIAETSRVVFDVGRDDSLPRRLEMHLELSRADIAGLGDSDDPRSDVLVFDVTVDLSQFGKDVSYDAPEDFRPLEDLLDQIFAGLE